MASGNRKQCEACGALVLAGPPEPWRALSSRQGRLSEEPEIARRRERARKLAMSNQARQA